jgi:uncharacterized membrane protein YhaH (DUF805 family)
MFCRKCGNEIKDGDRFCAKCGEPVEVIDVTSDEEVVLPRKKATFTQGIAALFSKTFSFKGTSSRSEFNYGLLFIYLISTVVSSMVITPMMSDMETSTNFIEIYEHMLIEMSSPDLTSPYNVATLAITLLYVVFLTAPIFRRTMDIYNNSKKATVFSVLFAVGQIVGSNYFVALIGNGLYDALSLVFGILSIASTVVMIICIFKKSAYRY